MIAYADFIAAFPEFAARPESQISWWISQAYAQLNGCRLGTQIDYAASLYVGHNLSLAPAAAGGTGATGGAASAMSDKTVGSVSAGYDTQNSAIQGAGVWNATSYGQRLYPLLRGASLGVSYVASRRGSPMGGGGFRGIMGF